MTAAMPNMPSPLLFTDAAAAKVKNLIEEEKNPADAARFCFRRRLLRFPVRIHVRGKRKRGRYARRESGVTLLVDPLSFQYLAGAEIDYKEDLNGAQLGTANPQAKTTSGCGSSFSA